MVGGSGSGCPGKFVAVVEDCCSVNLYGKCGKGVSPSCRTFGCRLTTAARIDARVWWCSEPPRFFLNCTCFENQDSEQVKLVTTVPNFGGLRFWLVCPSCSRRFTKLYCLGDRKSFQCRTCQGLTYRSCRESHEDDAIIAKIRQPGQSRAEALRSLREFRESLWASCGYGLKK